MAACSAATPGALGLSTGRTGRLALGDTTRVGHGLARHDRADRTDRLFGSAISYVPLIGAFWVGFVHDPYVVLLGLVGKRRTRQRCVRGWPRSGGYRSAPDPWVSLGFGPFLGFRSLASPSQNSGFGLGEPRGWLLDRLGLLRFHVLEKCPQVCAALLHLVA